MSEQKLKNKQVQGNEQFEKIINAVGKGLFCIMHICWYGLKRLKKEETGVIVMCLTCLILGWSYSAIYGHWHLIFLNYVWPALFSLPFTFKLVKIKAIYHFAVLFGGSVISILVALGLKEYKRTSRIKRAITDLRFTNPSGQNAKFLKIEDLGDGKSRVTATSGGRGIDKFELRRSDLTAGIGEFVEEVRPSKKSLLNVEIFLSQKELTSKYKFSSAKHLLTKPYTFIVGNSYKGPIVQSIRTLPHMFIAGTTGGGKSVFFNNVILGLMNSSERIRFYLIDLKKGLEVQDYKDVPGVSIAKSDQEALKMLTDLNALMDRRFEYLEKQGRRSIDPEKDKMDVIIIAFDEVSEIFDSTSRIKEIKLLRSQIYEKAHRLSKLSRAAGFHMIFSTQKIKKQLFPTEIQTNVGGRIAFKMPTSSDSVTAIGNKKAFDLPETKGRAIWHRGNSYREIQAPYLSDEDIKKEIKVLTEKFKEVENDERALNSKEKKTQKENEVEETSFSEGSKNDDES